jgi:hypothetical protein
MTRRTVLVMCAAAFGVVLTTVPVGASDPMGIYCVVNRVVMAPDEQHPTTAQVWGACATATGGPAEDGSYTPGWYATPRKGYLYYSAPKGKEDVCLREWTDLKRVAGTGEVVGFGGRRQNVGRIRLVSEVPRDPDPYPIQMGVTKLTSAMAAESSYADLISALRHAAAGQQ